MGIPKKEFSEQQEKSCRTGFRLKLFQSVTVRTSIQVRP